MNIPMIGNGFDLAHGLPTQYKDFLMFAKMVKVAVKTMGIENQIPTNKKEFEGWTDDIESLQCSNL